MIQISQIRLKPDSPETALHQAVYKALRLSPKDTCRIEIAKQSIDSRHKPDILYIYSVHVSDILLNGKKPVDEAAWIKKLKNRDITPVTQKGYTFPAVSRQILKEEDRPVIIGFGPAGMFAALKLAEAGLRPIVFERGDSIEQRKKEVEAFWQGGALNTESNVQFGEGGAGTFSDGKLNTAIKDPTGRIHEVLRIFAEFGADSRILYVNKPHIGTDVLAKVVQNIRKKITACGGEVHFQTKLTAIHEKDGAVNGITVFDRAENKSFTHACNTVCLAIGHSARDTFEMLLAQGISMQPKAFAVGVRMEHPQSFINQNAYGDCHYKLPAADYKVTFQTSTGKGVYSFCMCPGGYVVNASSEKERIAVNGMSYSGRNGDNANSAIVVTVDPSDFGGRDPLAGIAFQRKWEEAAYKAGQGKIPVQLYGDFCQNKIGSQLGGSLGDAPGKRLDAHLLPDDTGGGGQHILGADAECLGHKAAGIPRKLQAVRRAGVGVAAVHNDGLRVAVRKMLTVNRDGCAVDLVGGIAARARAAHRCLDKCQILFGVVVADAAMHTRCIKALRRTDTAGNRFEVAHCMYPSCYFISNLKSLPPRGKVAAGRMRAKSAIAARKRVVPARPPLISQRAEPLTASPAGGSHSNERRLLGP